jgi:DNA-directed RNA polymerase subunit RPC12/RpoP
MRLKHYISLNQKESADNMSVSQPTFSRILDKAHQKITQALIEGKDIRVYGGNINLKKGFQGYGCLNCDEEWEDESAAKERKVKCPNCNSKSVYYLVREPL